MSVKKYKQGKHTIIKWNDGDEVWYYYKRKLHREDGPAVENKDEDWMNEWWLNNKEYSEEKWKKEIRKRKLEALGL